MLLRALVSLPVGSHRDQAAVGGEFQHGIGIGLTHQLKLLRAEAQLLGQLQRQLQRFKAWGVWGCCNDDGASGLPFLQAKGSSLAMCPTMR